MSGMAQVQALVTSVTSKLVCAFRCSNAPASGSGSASTHGFARGQDWQQWISGIILLSFLSSLGWMLVGESPDCCDGSRANRLMPKMGLVKWRQKAIVIDNNGPRLNAMSLATIYIDNHPQNRYNSIIRSLIVST